MGPGGGLISGVIPAAAFGDGDLLGGVYGWSSGEGGLWRPLLHARPLCRQMRGVCVLECHRARLKGGFSMEPQSGRRAGRPGLGVWKPFYWWSSVRFAAVRRSPSASVVICPLARFGGSFPAGPVRRQFQRQWLERCRWRNWRTGGVCYAGGGPIGGWRFRGFGHSCISTFSLHGAGER